MTNTSTLSTHGAPAALSPAAAEVRALGRIITAVTVLIASVTILFSAITATRFVAEHGTPLWAASLVGVAVDAAFVMSLSADAFLARHGLGEPGNWPRRLRWFTGLSSVFLNDGQAVAAHDWTAVAIHTIAPSLLLLLAETAPAYRRAFALALVEVTPHAVPGTPAAVPEQQATVVPEPVPGPEPVPAPVEPSTGTRSALTRRTRPRSVPAPATRSGRTATDAELRLAATEVHRAALAATGRAPSIRHLRSELRIGQDRASALRTWLDEQRQTLADSGARPVSVLADSLA